MEQLQFREKEIFETLKKLKNCEFVLIGGYAVNAYTLPRFSVDCDIVIKKMEELEKIEKCLFDLNYIKVKNPPKISYLGNFERYEKEIEKRFKVSVDILIGEVLDRQTNAKISADWIFENSELRNLRGKTISEDLKLNIINTDALFVMKLISCRLTDIRDLFLLINFLKDKKWIKEEVSKRCDFNVRLSKLITKIKSKQFKDGLQGVFGIIDEKSFERNKNMISELSN